MHRQPNPPVLPKMAMGSPWETGSPDSSGLDPEFLVNGNYFQDKQEICGVPKKHCNCDKLPRSTGKEVSAAVFLTDSH